MSIEDFHASVSVEVGGGRVYRVSFPQCDSDSPRDDGGNRARLVLLGSAHRGVVLDEATDGTTAGDVLSHYLTEHGHTDHDEVVRRFDKWRAITGNDVRLFAGSGWLGYCQGDRADWFALAPDEDSARAEAELYCQWARGDVFAWVVYGPDGVLIDSCGGYYRYQDAEPDWRAAIEDNEARLGAQASTPGAGFVGVL